MFTKSARFYDAIYSFKDYQAEAARVREIAAGAVPEARSLLDVACGTGLHIEALIWSFHHVEGLDLDEELLEIAAERCPRAQFHHGDMIDFRLEKGFDVVTCLFSSIGYVRTIDKLDAAIATMAGHLNEPGVLIVEPWLHPGDYEEGHLGAVFVDEPDLKIARMNLAERTGDLSTMVFHYLVGTPAGFDSFEESHELGLFSHEQYAAAFEQAGLTVSHDPEGLMGRGLYIGTR